jgi:hypothetical protein
MAATDEPAVHVPWQFHGTPETYALAVRLYLTDLARRVAAIPDGSSPFGVVMDDMRELDLLPK